MRYIISIFLFFAWQGLQAQEFKATVSINTPKLQTADPKIFETLRSTVENLINNQQWTDNIYENEEKINIQIQMTIEETDAPNTFEAEFYIQATRPVYGSNYETALITHVDKDVRFNYEQYQPLEFAKNTYTNNLTSVIAFYAYTILGMDYDSFAQYGGEDHYQTAIDILSTVPNGVKGWRANDGSRNRHWIINNTLNPRVKPMRDAMYQYHRLGLDIMSVNVAEGRSKMLAALEKVNQVNQATRNMMIMQIFANTKSLEIIEIFKAGTRQEKNKVITIMSRVDPANASKYRQVR